MMGLMRKVVVLLTALWAAAGPLAAADWPMYARDRQRSNATDEPLDFPLHRAWTYQTAQPPRPAWPEPVKTLNRFDFDYAFHPVIAGGLVCFGSSADDTVRALDTESGTEKWHFTAGGPIRFAPQIADGKVYFSSDDGIIYCLDAATGNSVWTFNAAPADERLIGNERMIARWPARTGVLVDTGVVYCTAGMWPADGIFVYALDAASGKVLWCNDTSGLIYDARTLHMGADFATYGVCAQGPLLASDDTLLVPTGKALPAAFDRKTGQLHYYRIDADNNTQGGTWVTLDGNKFHTTPYIISFAIDTGKQVANNFGGGTIPPYTANIPNKAYATYECVRAVVTGGKAYARKAYGMVLADTTLVIGKAGAVTAESTAPRPAVDLRFALAGDDLAVLVRAADRMVMQQPSKPWDGSCIELFGALPGRTAIGQVFLIPGTKTLPAVALRSQAGNVVPAPEIRIQCTPTAQGYELAALIPLAQLALDKTSPEFRMEAQVTIPGPDGTLQRGTLFESTAAHRDSAKFGAFRLKPEPALASPDVVSKALAGAKRNAIAMGATNELWRTEVEGEARGLAVANGRLYVSTSKGMLYCFAAGEGKAEGGSRKDEGGIQNSVVSSQKSGPGTAGAKQSTIQNQKSAIAERLRSPGVDRGYALVIGDPEANVARELASGTGLRVILPVVGEAAARALREKLLATTALYGAHIHVAKVARLDALPFAPYFANAVIVAGPAEGLSATELYRVLRPCGGVLLCPGLDAASARQLMDAMGQAEAHEWASWSGRGRALSPKAPDVSQIGRPHHGGANSALAPTTSGESLSETGASGVSGGGPASPPAGDGADGPRGRDPSTGAGEGGWMIVRGRLPGALDWDSPFALDRRVQWPLRLLWFGGPGPALVMDRKQFTNIGPAANGRFFTIAQDTLSAVDTYNGAILWSRPIPKYVADLRLADDVHLIADAERIGNKTYGRGVHADGSNVYLTLSGYFGTNETACAVLDARTGEQKKIYGPYAVPPRVTLAGPQTWPLEIDAAHAGAVTLQAEADGLLLTLTTTDPTITPLDRWDLYFDFRPPATRYGLYDRGAFGLAVFPADGEAPASWRRGNGVAVPTVAVTGTRTGGHTRTTLRLAWAEMAALTGGKPESFGFGVRLNACDNMDRERVIQRYLFCDLAADGLNNGWANVILEQNAALADAAPAIVAGPHTALPKLPPLRGFAPPPGSQPVAQAPRRHPLTGAMGPKFYQTGGMCGGPAYSASAIFDRSTAISIYDFADDSGTRTFDGVKPGCATTMLASQGLLLSVEGRGGCTCTFNYQTSLALAPVEKRWHEDWALYFDLDADARVVSAALNLGAPGDRRADDGTLWLGFPRLDKGIGAPDLPPNSSVVGIGRRQVTGNLRVPLTVELDPDGGTYRFNADRVAISGTDRPWLYASGYRGLRKATLKLDCGATLVSTVAAPPPVLDGKTNDALWTGRPQAVLPAAKAEIFLHHDTDQLYVLARRLPFIGSRGDPVAWIGDAPKKGPADDQSFYNDSCWEVFLSDAHSRRVMHLRVMPTGARFDALSESAAATNENVKWNGVWTSAVVADTNGFAVEVAIPWKTLADAGLDKNSLAINVMANGPLRQSEALRFPGLRGREGCENFVPLSLGSPAAGSAARAYTVRLHFAEPAAEARPGRRVFDVKLQGQTVLTAFDVVKEAGAPRTALVKEFRGVRAAEHLTLECLPAAQAPTPETAPILCALELVAE